MNSTQKTSAIIKAGNVRITGSIIIDPTQNTIGPVTAGTQNAQARIAETTDTYAIIEFICSCGTRTRLQCDFEKEQ